MRRIRRRFYATLAGAFVLALASLFVPHIALAQSLPWQVAPTPLPGSGALDGPLSGVGGMVSTWVPIMTTFAERVFFLLIVIDVFWMGAQYVLGNRENAGELLAQGALKVITFTIVFELVILHGYQFSQIIIGSFMQAGGQLPGLNMNLSFSNLLTQGLAVATPLIVQTLVYAFIPNILGPVGFTNLQLPLLYTELFGATAVVGAYVFMAGALALAWLEMYFVTCAGIVMLGFSGSRWSSAFGYEKYLMYSFSIGIKLLMTYIVIDIANDIGQSMIAGELVPGIGAIEAGFTASIMTMLVFNIPSFAAALIQGSSSSSAGAGFSAASQAQAAMMSIMQMASDALQRTTMELQTRTQDQLAQNEQLGTQTLVGPGRDSVMATPAAAQTPLSAPGEDATSPPAVSQPAAYQPTPAVEGFMGAPPAAWNDISTAAAAMAADYFGTNGRAGRDAVGRDGKDGESAMFGPNGNGKFGEEIEELRVVEPAQAPPPALMGFTPAASVGMPSDFTEERLSELVQRYPEAFAAPGSLEFARPGLSDEGFARISDRATVASNDDVIDGRYTVIDSPSADAAYVPGSMNAAAGVDTELSQPIGISPEAAGAGAGPAGGIPLRDQADAMDRPLSFVGQAPDASVAPTELSGTAAFADGTRVNLGDVSAASFSTPSSGFGTAPEPPQMVSAANGMGIEGAVPPTSLSAPQSTGIGNDSYTTPFAQPIGSVPATELAGSSMSSGSTPSSGFGTAPEPPQMVSAPSGMGIESAVPSTSLSAPQSTGIGNDSYTTPFAQPVGSAPATELAGSSMSSGSTPSSGFGTAPEPPQMVSAPSGMGIESAVPSTSLSAPQSTGIGNESYTTPFAQPVGSAPATELAGSSTGIGSSSEPQMFASPGESQAVPSTFESRERSYSTQPIASSDGVPVNVGEMPLSSSAPEAVGAGTSGGTMSAAPSFAASPPIAESAGGLLNTSEARIPSSTPEAGVAGSSNGSAGAPALGSASVNLGDVTSTSFATPASGFGAAPELPQMVASPSQPQGAPLASESREQAYSAQPITSSEGVRANAGEMPLTSSASESVGAGGSGGTLSASPSSPSYAASPPIAESADGLNTSEARIPNSTPEAGVAGSSNGSAGAPALGSASVNLGDVTSTSFATSASGFGAAPELPQMVASPSQSQGAPLASESREQAYSAQPITSSEGVRANAGEMPLTSSASESVGAGGSGGTLSASPSSPSFAASAPIAESVGGLNTSEARIPNSTPEAGVAGSSNGSAGAPALGSASVNLGDVNSTSFTTPASGFATAPESLQTIAAPGQPQAVPLAFEPREQTDAAQPVTSSDGARANPGEMPLSSSAAEAVGAGTSNGTTSPSPSYAASPPIAESVGGLNTSEARIPNSTPEAGVAGSSNGSAGAPALGSASVNLGDVNSTSFTTPASGFATAPESSQTIAAPGQPQAVPLAFEPREQTDAAQPVTSSDGARANPGEMPLSSSAAEAVGAGTSNGTTSPSPSLPSFAASPPIAERFGDLNTSEARILSSTPDAGVNGSTARIPNSTPEAGVLGSSNGSAGAPALGSASVNLGDVNSTSFTTPASGFATAPESSQMIAAPGQPQAVPLAFEPREQTDAAQPDSSSDGARANPGEMPLSSSAGEAVAVGADTNGSRVGSASGVSNGSSSPATFGDPVSPPTPSATSPRVSVDSATDGSRVGAFSGGNVTSQAVNIRLGNDVNPVIAPTTFTVTSTRQASDVSELDAGDSESSRTTSYRAIDANGSGSRRSGSSDDVNGGAAFDGNRTSAYVPNAATSTDGLPVASGARFVTTPTTTTNGVSGGPVPPPVAVPASGTSASAIASAPQVAQTGASAAVNNPTAVGARFSSDTAARDVFGSKPDQTVRERSVERQIETRLTSSSEASASADAATFRKPEDPGGKWTEAEIRKMADAQLRSLVDEREFSARPLDERVTMLVEAERRFGNESGPA